MIWKLAWRNIWRHPRRTLLNAIAIALVTGIMIFLPSFQDGSYRSMIRASVGTLDGFGQLQHPDYLDNPSIRNSFLVKPEIASFLSKNLDSNSYEERASAFGLLSSDDRSFGARIVGVEPEKNESLSTIPQNLVLGRYLKNGSEIILGTGLARNLKVDTGDRVTLIGTGRDGSLAAANLEIVALFETGFPELDRSLAQIPLNQFDETFSMEGHRHGIVFSSQAISDLSNTALPSAIVSSLAIRTWKELQPGLLHAIQIDIGSAIMMYLILIFVICFSLLNAALMSALERTREFGTMLALGVRPRILSKMVWIENGLILMVGIAGGYILGVTATLWLAKTGIQFPSAEELFAQYGLSSTIFPNVTALTITIGPAIIALVALSLGAYPSYRVRRLDPIDAMKAV